MKWHEMRSDEVMDTIHSDRDVGLTNKEVQKRTQKFGLNELKEADRPSAIIIFLNQFKDFMVLVLLAATLISGLLGEYIDAIAIIAIVIVNGVLGFFRRDVLNVP